MPIDHLALWTRDLEALRRFYETYFDAQCGPRYTNPAKGFTSYFLSFPPGAGSRLEIMQVPDLAEPSGSGTAAGLAHFAISVSSTAQVDELTARLARDGFTVASPPRWTGDGYYESVILDPDRNRVEITVEQINHKP